MIHIILLAFKCTVGYTLCNLLLSAIKNTMQPRRYLHHWLDQHADEQHYLFSLQNLRALYPQLSNSAFKTLFSRAVDDSHLIRVCRGLYAVEKAIPPDGLLLFHAAVILRAKEFNYVSLETILSETGIISQVPMNWITIMSSGRSNTISCGEFGTIEFIHTEQKPVTIMNQLSYDNRYGMWRANVSLALRDMKVTHRNCDLIDWDIAHEFI
jgi:hypothetical protein